MNKKWIYLLCIVVLISFIFYKQYFGKDNLIKPPQISVKSSFGEVKPVLGPYSWEYRSLLGGKKYVQASSPIPPELVKDRNPLIVKSGGELEIITIYKPARLSVSIWQNNNKMSPKLNGNKIVAPKEKGKYVYSVSIKWKQGIANYAFLVEVK
ncbi:hypothetical protein [Thermohalobacter berrensis]|uniref:Uncharacterized protein n=1 Tax=Thermohalobacter berrensis TaxID=99594 RepID=A0A419T790_9FIRM|nr:hypothetical protein [Thermohalobacter berrensis]RKD33430.1 hypothetical protein BET03_09255 [Thermohalobacter berrensis]